MKRHTYVAITCLISGSLLLTACSGGAGTNVREIDQPEPTQPAVTAPENTPAPEAEDTLDPEPTETTPETPSDDSQPDDAAPGALEVTVGDTLGVDIPNEMYDAEDGQGFEDWNFSASWTKNIAPHVPARDGFEGRENYTLLGEALPNSSTHIFIVNGEGAGSISVTYTNPDTGETTEVHQELLATEEGPE